MRKTTILLLCSLFWLSATIAHGQNIMKVHDATGLTGENILIDIEIINEDQFVAFQFDTPLPEGFGYVAGSITLNPARKVDHLANANVLPGTNIFRAIAFSFSNAWFIGNSGIVATFSLTTPETAGTYPLIPENSVISNIQGQNILTGYINGVITLISGIQTLPGDSNCDGEVNVMDVITTINYILGNNPQPFCFIEADVNGDGSVNAIDVIGTINIILSVSFTCGTSTITDVDGNVYNTVLIGEQCWMKENLKTTQYRNNTPIEYPGTNNNAWQNNTTGAYAWFNNDINWKDSYGALYNWHAVNNTNGLCPTGWHVPTDDEFTAAIYHLGGAFVAGGKMKSTHTVPDPHPRWESPNTGATNESNWSAFPGGYRSLDGIFYHIGYFGYWWSSTGYSSSFAWIQLMLYDYAYLYHEYFHKVHGFSVRCLSDQVRTEVD